jgi:hypothetical protein
MGAELANVNETCHWSIVEKPVIGQSDTAAII